jgi:hypothetical protein
MGCLLYLCILSQQLNENYKYSTHFFRFLFEYGSFGPQFRAQINKYDFLSIAVRFIFAESDANRYQPPDHE